MSEQRRGRGRPRAAGDLVCDRCGRSTRALPWRWPDGRICRTCYREAAQTRGTCSGCGQQRLVPGRGPAGEPLCRDCAGITAKLDCTACGAEGLLEKSGLCVRCSLRSDLAEVLQPARHPQAVPVVEALCSTGRPASIRTWMRGPAPAALLAGLGDGSIGYSHDALDRLPGGRAVEHLRGILVAAGALPDEHRTAERLERWLAQALAGMDDGPDKDLVRQFARWHHVRLIRGHGTDRDAAFGSYVQAKQSITETIRFLEHLRRTGTAPADADQDDLHAWLRRSRTHQHVEQFVSWARRTGRLPQLRASHPGKTVTVMTVQERDSHIQALALDDGLPLDLRTAGMLVLIYGSTITRIVGLPRDAVAPGPPTLLRLADQPVPVPEPAAEVLRQHLARHRISATMAGQDQRWLFPGTTPGTHLHRQTLTTRLQQYGIPIRAARNRALQHLTTAAPPPVVADLLGYHPGTAFKHHEQAAGRYSGYASAAAQALQDVTQ